MNVVILQLLCAVAILTIIAISYVVSQNLGEKGIKPFSHDIFRWIFSFSVGILLFLFGVKLILLL